MLRPYRSPQGDFALLILLVSERRVLRSQRFGTRAATRRGAFEATLLMPEGNKRVDTKRPAGRQVRRHERHRRH